MGMGDRSWSASAWCIKFGVTPGALASMACAFFDPYRTQQGIREQFQNGCQRTSAHHDGPDWWLPTHIGSDHPSDEQHPDTFLAICPYK